MENYTHPDLKRYIQDKHSEIVFNRIQKKYLAKAVIVVGMLCWAVVLFVK